MICLKGGETLAEARLEYIDLRKQFFVYKPINYDTAFVDEGLSSLAFKLSLSFF